MKTKLLLLFPMLFCIQYLLYSQQRILVPQEHFIAIDAEYSSKILSGDVLVSLNEKNYLRALNPGIENEGTNNLLLTVYFNEMPQFDQMDLLDSEGIKLYPQTWIPPLENHPYGFMIAKVPLDKMNSLLSKSFVLKVGSAESLHETNNNTGTSLIKANQVWIGGWTGTGVKVAVLDSGLDTEPLNSDLPATLEKRDYSNYPTSIDNNVENTVSGHGTHVTGSVLGRGTLSNSNTINGGGPYRGSAPAADLVFLKIGSDANSNATGAAMIAAIQSAVDTFNAQIITMSYGGWYAHHDGSSAEEQTVDWAYSQGVPVFLSAGNDGNKGRHYSGIVNANSETGFIQITVTGAGVNNTALFFNLVWSDGTDRNNLSLNYYNSSQVALGSIIQDPAIESLRGTESRYSNYNFYLPSGNGTYYLKVVNPSNVSQSFHIYERWGARVTFNSPDPDYTVGQPSTADNSFSVGAFTSRVNWTASDGGGYSYAGSGTLFDIAPFSSRGPRIDGVVKPNITAPGTAIISMRDRDVLTISNAFWIDNDGISGGVANYYVMQGTSMATPLAAGTAALILQRYPSVTPAMIYSVLQNYSGTDAFTGAVPNNTWGYGKLDILEVMNNGNLPVELTSFTASVQGGIVKLNWRTETEVNNYGFEIQRSSERIGINTFSWEVLGFIDGNGNSNSPVQYSFVDERVTSGKYSYRLKQIDNDGKFEYTKNVEVDFSQPTIFSLNQNYPNPFNPVTTIKYSLPTESEVNVSVFNILGQKVVALVQQNQPAGYFETRFDANNFPSGIYFYTITARSLETDQVFVQTRKMLLLK